MPMRMFLKMLWCVGLGSSVFGQVQGQAEETVTHTIAEQARPLDEAIILIASEYGVSVSYEEPMIVHPDDIVDRSLKKGAASLTHRGGTFRFSVKRSGRTLTNPRAALESMVQQYNAAGLTGRFQVKPAGPLLAITPMSVKDRFGVLTPALSPLDAPVKIKEQRVGGLDMMKLVCDAASAASGMKVYPGMLPKPLTDGFATIRGDGEEARLVLARALGTLEFRDPRIQAPRPLYRWILYYWIEHKAFLLHVAPARRPRAQPAGEDPRWRRDGDVR